MCYVLCLRGPPPLGVPALSAYHLIGTSPSLLFSMLHIDLRI